MVQQPYTNQTQVHEMKNSQAIRAKASTLTEKAQIEKLLRAAEYEEYLESLPAVELDLDLTEEEEESQVVEQVTKAVDTKEAVYAALVKAEEGGGYVYLDNINLKALGITEQQFAGYCSALAKEGRYEPTSDKAFGILKR